MPSTSTLAIVAAGFFAGFIGTMLFTRALRLLYTLLGRSQGEPQRFVPKKRVWAIPFLVLHPGVWFLVGIPALAYLAYSGRIPAVWGWFVVGFCLSVVYMGTLLLFAIHRLRRKRARAAGA